MWLKIPDWEWKCKQLKKLRMHLICILRIPSCRVSSASAALCACVCMGMTIALARIKGLSLPVKAFMSTVWGVGILRTSSSYEQGLKPWTSTKQRSASLCAPPKRTGRSGNMCSRLTCMAQRGWRCGVKRGKKIEQERNKVTLKWNHWKCHTYEKNKREGKALGKKVPLQPAAFSMHVNACERQFWCNQC